MRIPHLIVELPYLALAHFPLLRSRKGGEGRYGVGGGGDMVGFLERNCECNAKKKAGGCVCMCIKVDRKWEVNMRKKEEKQN